MFSTTSQLSTLRTSIGNYWGSQSSIAPLVTFRVLFGLVAALGALRFMQAGWVESLIAEPTFFFDYTGFSWILRPGLTSGYILYTIIAASALLVAIGFLYRVATLVFFLSFTYAQLIDATNYLNHYYLVVLLGFLLCFLPANRAISVDVALKRTSKLAVVPAWCIHIIMVQLAVVYFYAGVAKLNSDWLFQAMPMAIWLPERSWWPVLGQLFEVPATAFVFSWFGMLYDLTIVGWLCYAPTRPFAYGAVLVFHIATALLFNIGLFPIIMITSTLIFFSAAWHERLWNRMLTVVFALPHSISIFIPSLSAKQVSFAYQPFGAATKQNTKSFQAIFSSARSLSNQSEQTPMEYAHQATRQSPSNLTKWLLTGFVCVQLLFPLRAYAFEGPAAWSEQGYRFGWRVMLVEKVGFATFTAVNPATGTRLLIDNQDYLTPYQEKQMAIQPEFIVQFAKHISAQLQQQGWESPEVYAEAYVSLNARRSKLLVDPTVNLAAQKLTCIDLPFPTSSPNPWILPFQ